MKEPKNGVVKRDENARHNLPLNSYAGTGLAFVELDLKWSPVGHQKHFSAGAKTSTLS
jgi:hypothetical protein